MDFLGEFLRLIRHLNREGVAYILVGGAAMNVQGLVRATEDIDLFVEPSETNIAKLRAALHATWSDPTIDEITSEDLCGEYPSVRYGPPEGSLYVDIITRLGKATRYEDLRFETVEHHGEKIRVATPSSLHRMKRNTVRPIDRADADRIAQAFVIEEDET